LQLSQKSTEGWCLEALKRRHNDVVARRRNFAKEHRVHFTEIVKGALDGQNPLRGVHKVPRTVRSCRGARRFTTSVFFCLSSGENRRRIWTNSSDHLHIFHFGVSGGEGSKPLDQGSRDRERQSQR
jgi:hypothetical protein